jgi:hypothetical protein
MRDVFRSRDLVHFDATDNHAPISILTNTDIADMAIQQRVTDGLIVIALILSGFGSATAFADAAPGTPILKKKPAPSIEHSIPGCTWIAQKTLFAILREDIVSANDLMVLFDRFECPKLRLRQAFDCAATQSSSQSAEATNAAIDACWEDPVAPPLKPTTPSDTPAQKSK